MAEANEVVCILKADDAAVRVGESRRNVADGGEAARDRYYCKVCGSPLCKVPPERRLLAAAAAAARAADAAADAAARAAAADADAAVLPTLLLLLLLLPPLRVAPRLGRGAWGSTTPTPFARGEIGCENLELQGWLQRGPAVLETQ